LPALLAMVPRARLGGFAPDATRALLVSGNNEAALRWAAVASRDEADALWPVLRAAGVDHNERTLNDGVDAWQRAASVRDSGFARTRLDVVRTILGATDALGTAETRRVGARGAGDVPAESEALASLARAADAGRRGETALHAARILVAAPSANAIAAVVR